MMLFLCVEEIGSYCFSAKHNSLGSKTDKSLIDSGTGLSLYNPYFSDDLLQRKHLNHLIIVLTKL